MEDQSVELGGHMRSHLMNIRGNPKKSWRVADSSVDRREQEEVAMCLMMLSRDDHNNNNKRHKFECTACNKSFHSYQALGGHRASHKKMKARIGIDQIETSSSIQEGHECPICLKVFGSGQALGGHKRSHLMGSYDPNKTQPTIVIPEIRDFLDLNLPAPYPPEQDTTSVHPWWVMATTHHNHDPLVALI